MYAIKVAPTEALILNQDKSVINTQPIYPQTSTSETTSETTSGTTQVKNEEEKEWILWGKKINPQAYNSNILWGVQACKSRYRATYNSLVDFRRAMGVPASGRGAFTANQIIKMDCGWVASRMQNPRITRREFLKLWEDYLSFPPEGRLIEYFQDVYRVSFPEYLVETQNSDFLESLPVSAVLVYCSAYLNQKTSTQQSGD
ncbi:hypothetical protein [Laspinema olomoucense]|uniref:Uncharacterized protein n=1 Tax=Laspinema olomoucense D3b TaxID=2953688 RepID=A0ABT2N4W4_9CYAN|nr:MULTISPECIES: hypothetical protein [unclassified Laspinema]MCT7977703.1 hypothetical protein [Laspinema sp. D3b]MCT7992549.1 hypothetical protein [Laspinema sp. D3c]